MVQGKKKDGEHFACTFNSRSNLVIICSYKAMHDAARLFFKLIGNLIFSLLSANLIFFIH